MGKKKSLDSPDAYEIADLLVEKFNYCVMSEPEMQVFTLIGDSEDLAELIDENFNTKALNALLVSDFTQGMLFGFVCALERIRKEEDEILED